MKLVVTVLEETCARAVAAIRAIDLPHDMVEVRAERFPSIDFEAIHAATDKPIILTYRGAVPPPLHGWRGLIDVEWREGVTVEHPSRTVLSHHDYERVRDAEEIMARMRALGCAYTKLAATPRTFAENERLLKLLPGTVIGMGERGLYSRILAPFLGSELAFVAATNVAAPGQLTLGRAREIYGDAPQKGERVFAVVGDPAGHSLSPVIHNRLFRERGVPAAYTIASFASFDEVREAFLRGEPCGLSVTTPFKEEALRVGAEVGENARRARAVNTLVNVNGRILADNTDVDGFAALIGAPAAGRPLRRPLAGTDRRRAAGGAAGEPPALQRAAVLGRGPTARAALVALEDAGIPAVVFHRDNMQDLPTFSGELIVNTLPPEAEVRIPPCRTYIEAAYSGTPREVEAETRFGGLDLLHAQAVRQHQLFMKVFDGL